MLHFLKEAPAATSLDATIQSRRPILARILHEHGGETLHSFGISNLRNLPKPPSERLEEFLQGVSAILEPRIGPHRSNAICRQLQKFYVVCSADHHGPLNGSPLVNVVSSNAWLANSLISMKDADCQHIVVLSCASISQNVEDYPRGILFSTYTDERWTTRELPILPSSRRMSVVYNHRAWNHEEIDRAQKNLAIMRRDGLLTSDQWKIIQDILHDIYGAPSVLQSRSLTEQVTRVNTALWNQLWDEPLPSLTYLDMESLATHLLCENHLHRPTAFHRMIFVEKDRNYLSALEAAMAPSLRQGHQPTNLFWALSENGRRIGLILCDNHLRSIDGSVIFALKPEIIGAALMKKKIFPGLFLSLSLLHLYYGLNCLGGAMQIQYLDAIRRVYASTSLDVDFPTPRSDLYNFGPDFVFLDKACSTPAHALDILLHGEVGRFKDLQSSLNAVTLRQAFNQSSHVIRTILSITEPIK